MVDGIIIVIVIILLGCALKGTVKHFKGEGPCCGGGSGNTKKAKTKFLDGPVIGRRTLKISGMHCEHCVKSVTEEINKIEGASAKVNLKKEEAVVSYDREIDDDDLKKAVEEAGFKVVDIKA